MQAGTYELYAFTAGTPTANQFQIGSSPSGFLFSVNVTPNQEVDLSVQVAPILVWTGAVNNAWDTTTANWNSQSGLFASGDGAQFDDTNTSGHNTIAIDAAGVVSSKVVFANSMEDYSIDGPGAISGTGGFSKSGSGTVTINVTNNTNAGATTITSGTLAIASDGSLGAVPGAAIPNQLTINGGQLTVLGSTTLATTRGIQIGNAAGMIGANATTGGTINVAGPATNVATYNGVIADVSGQTGTLTKAGGGELDLGGANTYSGPTTITGGVLSIASNGNLGAVPATVQPAAITINGGTLRVTTGTAANAGAGVATLNTNRGITLGASGGTIGIGFTDPTTGAAHNGTEIGAGLQRRHHGPWRIDAQWSGRRQCLAHHRSSLFDSRSRRRRYLSGRHNHQQRGRRGQFRHDRHQQRGGDCQHSADEHDAQSHQQRRLELEQCEFEPHGGGAQRRCHGTIGNDERDERRRLDPRRLGQLFLPGDHRCLHGLWEDRR